MRLASTFQQLSQAKLAEALGIPQRRLSFYEREAGDIPAGLAPPMSRALDVSVDELLGETEKKKRAGAGSASNGYDQRCGGLGSVNRRHLQQANDADLTANSNNPQCSFFELFTGSCF